MTALTTTVAKYHIAIHNIHIHTINIPTTIHVPSYLSIPYINTM